MVLVLSNNKINSSIEKSLNLWATNAVTGNMDMGYIANSHTDQLPDGLLAQLIAEL